MPAKHKQNNMVSIWTLFPLKKFSAKLWSGASQCTQWTLNGAGVEGEIGVAKSWTTHGGGPMCPQWRHQNRLFSANVVLYRRTHRSSRRGKEGGKDPVRERVNLLSGSPPPPFPVWISILTFTGQFLDDEILHCLLWSFYDLRLITPKWAEKTGIQI